FGLVERLSYYPPDDLAQILVRSAGILAVPADAAGIAEIARRSRGTPRVANRLLKRVRDFAQVRANGKITAQVAGEALKRLDVDESGLDDMDGRLLQTIIEQFDGGPVGLTTIAAAVGEEPGTLEEVYEPLLMQRGFLARTPRGRCATGAAYQQLGFIPPRREGQARTAGHVRRGQCRRDRRDAGRRAAKSEVRGRARRWRDACQVRRDAAAPLHPPAAGPGRPRALPDRLRDARRQCGCAH